MTRRRPNWNEASLSEDPAITLLERFVYTLVPDDLESPDDLKPLR